MLAAMLCVVGSRSSGPDADVYVCVRRVDGVFLACSASSASPRRCGEPLAALHPSAEVGGPPPVCASKGWSRRALGYAHAGGIKILGKKDIACSNRRGAIQAHRDKDPAAGARAISIRPPP